MEAIAPLRLRGGGDGDECDDENGEKSHQNLSTKRHRKQEGKKKSPNNGKSAKKAKMLFDEFF